MPDTSKTLWKRVKRADGSNYDTVGHFEHHEIEAAKAEGWKESADDHDRQEQRDEQPSQGAEQPGQSGEQRAGDDQHREHSERGGDADQSGSGGQQQPVWDEPGTDQPAAGGKRRR
jgi:hypothetical protein